MNKNELVGKVAGDTKLSKTDVMSVLESILQQITGALKSGEPVRLVGFGTFSVLERKPTEGRDPRTKQPIQIPASKNPRFKSGKSLKDAVNGS